MMSSGYTYELLAPVYDWFTEGFDTPDLHDARALLDDLAGAGQHAPATDPVLAIPTAG